jgi:hypothetical protein
MITANDSVRKSIESAIYHVSNGGSPRVWANIVEMDAHFEGVDVSEDAIYEILRRVERERFVKEM